MQPYVPTIVMDALVEERLREIRGYKPEPMYQPGPAVRRQIGAMLVRVGTWLQGPRSRQSPRPRPA